eukprot:5229224-Pleurochrysis_carterae.AAC.3
MHVSLPAWMLGKAIATPMKMCDPIHFLPEVRTAERKQGSRRHQNMHTKLLGNTLDRRQTRLSKGANKRYDAMRVNGGSRRALRGANCVDSGFSL